MIVRFVAARRDDLITATRSRARFLFNANCPNNRTFIRFDARLHMFGEREWHFGCAGYPHRQRFKECA